MKATIRGVLLLAIMAITAVGLTGCAAQKQQSVTRIVDADSLQSMRTDSVEMLDAGMQSATSSTRLSQGAVTYSLHSQGIPQEAASLELGMTALRDLPEGSGYRAQSGRASVDVRRAGDAIEVTATCDSVSRMLEYYYDLSYEQYLALDSINWELCRQREYSAEADDRVQFYREQCEDLRKNPPNSIKAAASGFLLGAIATPGIIYMFNYKKQE